MSNILMVPVHLDAIVLDVDQQVVGAMADFTLLPYSYAKRDVNPEIPYISEEIVSKPFQNKSLLLKAGIHLHWALPDALTKGTQTATGTNFPAVPNRWLVVCRSKDAEGTFKVERQWMIESDYLHPEQQGEQVGSVTIPSPSSGANNNRQPFRFLGRRMPLAVWQKESPEAEYLQPLTAVGYGEPTFAAFYPNCHSVFGFYDDYTRGILDGLQYDVIGWYSDGNQDYLRTIVEALTLDFQQRGKASPSNEDLREALESQAQWTYAVEDNDEFPKQMLCYGRLSFGQAGNSLDNQAKADANTTITVANTGSEALSAYLADVIVRGQNAETIVQTDAKKKAKSDIEDQLEAVQFSDRLDTRQLDVGAKLTESRHEKGFTAVPGGSLWTVAPDTQDTQAEADNADVEAQSTLPPKMAYQLNTLNLLQHQYDRAIQEIESLRKQLFSDWYKYMLCAYPPEDSRDDYPNIDEVKNFIEVKGISPLQDKIASTGTLLIQTENGQITVSTMDSSAGSLALQVKQAIDELQQAILTYNNSPDAQQTKTIYSLRQVPSPRYWQPNEPVVLLTGAAVKPTPRHGEDGRLRDDGLLECQLLKNQNIQDLLPNGWAAATGKMDEISPAANESKIGFDTWTQQPWHPFLLEWEVEVFPIESDGNTGIESGSYASGFITSNYNLSENDPELSVKPGKGAVTKAANVYTGSSILTGYANLLLKEDLEDFLEKQLLEEYYESRKIPQAEQTENYFNEHVSDILGWYLDANCTGEAETPTCNLIRAYNLITAPDFYSLSQSLSGFNDGLLMHKQTLQLSIADPLGFEEYQAFAQRVSDAVQGSIRSAPEPLNDFNPIRSGALKLTRLRLVDTFGQVKDLDCSQVSTTEKMTLPDNAYLMSLPPRVVQPARLNFRWLSAAQDEEEMNDHPATSPICGWLLPNNLDNSLMIYDGAGKALGSINSQAQWESVPGSALATKPEDISNPHLKKLVDYITHRGSGFVNDFITAIDNALEHIEPENFAQHRDIALLIGSPIALVRASLNLELQSLPCVHQGWEAFRQDLKRIFRQTSHFEHVRFPIRLGEYKQFNDGVVGYWIEDSEGIENSSFYAPQTDSIDNPYIKTHADDQMTVYQTIRFPPQNLTMLIDPRGKAHATAGIVPCKAINIPPDQYTDALEAINVTFFSAPILTPLGEINLPLPDEPGYRWSWLQKDNATWYETSTTGSVNKQVFLNAFDDGADVWARLLAQGWIKEIDAATASVVAKDARTNQDLGADMEDKVEAIEIILARSSIRNVTLEAKFTGEQVINEGWLKLSEATDASKAT